MADTLQIRRPGSGDEHEFVITDATIRAPELRQFVVDGEPLATYDPGFMNTAACRSSASAAGLRCSTWHSAAPCTSTCPT